MIQDTPSKLQFFTYEIEFHYFDVIRENIFLINKNVIQDSLKVKILLILNRKTDGYILSEIQGRFAMFGIKNPSIII